MIEPCVCFNWAWLYSLHLRKLISSQFSFVETNKQLEGARQKNSLIFLCIILCMSLSSMFFINFILVYVQIKIQTSKKPRKLWFFYIITSKYQLNIFRSVVSVNFIIFLTHQTGLFTKVNIIIIIKLWMPF